jgi:AI-2E family transporter
MTFIPNLGPILSVFPAALLAIAISPGKGLLTVLLFALVHFLEGNIITPLLRRPIVRLPPALTLTVQLLLAVIEGLSVWPSRHPSQPPRLVFSKCFFRRTRSRLLQPVRLLRNAITKPKLEFWVVDRQAGIEPTDYSGERPIEFSTAAARIGGGPRTLVCDD